MPCSPARLEANRRNALLSSGPKTEEGKPRSRANALKHGLTGAGVVLPDEDVARVEERFEEFEADLKPVNGVARFLARRAAMLSVRLDRCVRNESAAIASRMRRAEADFEHERLAEVDHTFSYIAREPATYARKLRSMPEGIDRIDPVPAGHPGGTGPRQRGPLGLGLRRPDHQPDGRPVDGGPGHAGPGALRGDLRELRLPAARRRRRARRRGPPRLGPPADGRPDRRGSRGPRRTPRDARPLGDRGGTRGARPGRSSSPRRRRPSPRKYEAAAERGLFRTLREIREIGNGPAADPGPSIAPPPAVEPGSGPAEGPGAPPAAGPMGSFFPEAPGPIATPRGTARPPGRGRPPATVRARRPVLTITFSRNRAPPTGRPPAAPPGAVALPRLRASRR